MIVKCIYNNYLMNFFGGLMYNSSMGGGVTAKILENHVRENTGWILFKTRNFYIFLDIQ